MPPDCVRYGETWAEHHPGWEIRQWGEEDLPPLRNQGLYDRAAELVPEPNIGQFLADVARYELLWRFGGVYVDADFECLRSIEGLLEGVECFAVWEEQDLWAANGLMGAVPGHPFLDLLIRVLPAHVESRRGQRPNRSSGPQYLTKMLRAHGDGVAVLPERLFFPYSYRDIGDPEKTTPPWPERFHAVHHWHNRRRSLARAEARGRP